MRKLEKLQIVKNVASNQMNLATNVLAGFFLYPYVVHRLGDDASGIWFLIFAITGYYGLFDMGIRSSVVRYISKAKATNDMEGASRVISTSLFSYSCIGAMALLSTFVVSLYVGKFHSVRVHPEYQATARWLLLMAGSAVALGFPLGVSGGILEGLQRFDALNLPNMAATLLRVVLILISLQHGYGLLTITLITVAMPLLASMVRAAIAARLLPVPLGFRFVDRTTFREIATFSGTTLIMIVAVRLRFRSDSIIIGSFLSAAAITHFNIGSRIVDYAGEVVETMAQVFAPMSSHAEASGDMDRLRKIFVAGNRFCALTIFPICVLLVILGRSVIEVWMGKRYVAQSYPILLLLLFPTALLLAQAASGRVLLGMGKHRTWAFVMLAEGLVNIFLSILLVRPYGIVGDAIGTAVPLTVTTICFLPWHLCRKLQIRMSTYLREAYLLALGLCVPLVMALLLMQHWFVPHNYLHLAVHLAVAGLVYGLALSWAFASNRALRVGNLVQVIGADSSTVTTAPETFPQDI